MTVKDLKDFLEYADGDMELVLEEKTSDGWQYRPLEATGSIPARNFITFETMRPL